MNLAALLLTFKKKLKIDCLEAHMVFLLCTAKSISGNNYHTKLLKLHLLFNKN